MSTMSVRAGVIAFVTAVATMANAPTALAGLPEHKLVAEFFDESLPIADPSGSHLVDYGFGEAVAIRDDVAFIGVPRARDNGHVIVLNLTATGWKQVQTLTAPNPSTASHFGRVLTFRDGVLVVGGENAAYVFKRGNRFKLTQTLRPPATDGVEGFPGALRYEGGTLLASGSRSTAPSVVYVFERDSTGVFVRRAKVKASDGTAGDSFGASISMTSRLFVVGSPGDAAYTFRRNSSGNWVQAQKLVPAVPADGFGTAVAIDRDMILVGAPFVDLEGGDRGSPTPDDHVAQGAVFGFLPGVSGYIESFKLRPRPDERGQYEQFGSAIAMSGARIAVTATGWDAPSSGGQPEGLVFTYTRNGSSVLARGIASRENGPVTGMGLSNNALLIGAFFGQLSCRFVCERVARIYDDNLFEQ